MGTASQSKMNVPEELLTARAVNRMFDEVRDEFNSIGISRPVLFIAWQHQLAEVDMNRLAQAFCNRASKSDLDLLQKAKVTFKQMKGGHLKAAI